MSRTIIDLSCTVILQEKTDQKEEIFECELSIISNEYYTFRFSVLFVHERTEMKKKKKSGLIMCEPTINRSRK